MKIKWLSAVVPLLFCGCATSHQINTNNEVNVKPIEIKPIHITIDINVKVDRALDDFFDDVDTTAKEVRKHENAPAVKPLAKATEVKPEAKAPEVKPEVKAPEVKPEVKAPEVKTPEAKAPEKTEVQPQVK